MNLHNKTIILTGARRIGQFVALDLAKKGANLCLTYLTDEGEITKLCQQCEKLGVKTLVIQADLSKRGDVNKVIQEARREFGSIDGLIHMAASYIKTPWNSLSEDQWEKQMNIIAKSTFLISKAVGDELLKNKGEIKGKIITVSDWSILRSPYKDYLVYNSAKSAVIGLTLSLAKELAPSITVNNIAPGPTIKPLDLTEEENEQVLNNTPLKRWGGGEEIAKAVLYLLDADFVTGVILPVDGGRSID
jgi:pteridine reductase